MAKKISGLNYNKGFNRIFKVIAGLWIALITALAFADYSYCFIHGDKLSVTGGTNAESVECMGVTKDTLLIQWLFMCSLVVPVYYFINWIVSGFKK